MPPDIGENFDPPMDSWRADDEWLNQPVSHEINYEPYPRPYPRLAPGETLDLPDQPPVGTVLAYVVRLGDRDYHYASLRAGDGRWYSTGGSAAQAVDWRTVVTALRAKQARVWSATHWTEWSL